MKKLLLMIMMLAPVSMFAQKFGRVNSAEVIQVMPEYQTAQKALQTLENQYSQDLQRMQDELKKKSDDYQKEKATLPEAIQKRREQELQDMYNRLMQSQQTSQQDLQKQSQEKMSVITDKVTKAIQSVGQTGGYVYIVDMAQGFPYISDTLTKDVTSEVKVKLGLNPNAKPAPATPAKAPATKK